jgi:hypothetical protein
MNASHMVIKKTIVYTVLALVIGLVISSYAGGEKKADTSSLENVPETYTLGRLAKIYEPVLFSHGMHSLVAEDCAVCHHHREAGHPPACHNCHGVSLGSQESSMPGLKDAYHRQCIGCHKEIDMGPTGCIECHAKRTSKAPPSTPSKKQIKEASRDGPETCTLNGLEKKYEPVVFSHNMHAVMTENCASCHHHSSAGQTLSCGECHGAPFDPKNLNMPGLKGAYHLQCMGCHKEIGGPLGCTKCHAKKTGQTRGMDKK